MTGPECKSTCRGVPCQLPAGHADQHRNGIHRWIVSDSTIAEAEAMAEDDRERAEARAGDGLRELAAELDKQACVGPEVTLSPELTRRLAGWLESAAAIADIDRREQRRNDRQTRKAFAFLAAWRARS